MEEDSSSKWQETFGPRKQRPIGQTPSAKGCCTYKQQTRGMRKGMVWFKSVEGEWKAEGVQTALIAGRTHLGHSPD